MFIPPAEGSFLLHLPDLYHELSHPLLTHQDHPVLVCFVRKVCRFAMKGLPLGLQETTSGFWEPSTGLDKRTT